VKYSKKALKIAQGIIKDSSSVDHRFRLEDLLQLGVTGNLLEEVVFVLDKCGMLADVTIDDAFEEVAADNIKRLKKELVVEKSKGKKAELALLQGEPYHYIGIPVPIHVRYVAADTGIPFGVPSTNDSFELFSRYFNTSYANSVILNGELVTLLEENHKLTH